MAQIDAIRISVERRIDLPGYEFIKPYAGATVHLEPGDDLNEVIHQASGMLKETIAVIVADTLHKYGIYRGTSDDISVTMPEGWTIRMDEVVAEVLKEKAQEE